VQYNNLGRTDVKVSALCLGSMTWGTQNTLDEGHAQIDAALAHGVNFIDTAELYPTNPVLAENIGRTEEIIGAWFNNRGRRDDVFLATKISGVGQQAVRGGGPITAATVRDGLDASLKRLRTDVIDLYQLHLPNRGSYHFRRHWGFDASGQPREATQDNMLEVLQEIGRQVAAGKIRYFGLSNETTWGIAKWLQLASENNLPRAVSIQNEYSLLCRHFDTDLAELSHHEDVGLLAFSPLAAGLLAGKYGPELTPPASRRSINETLSGRVTPRVWGAIDAYLDVAARHGLDPVQMAIAWATSRPFMTSVLIGATSMFQLETALGAGNLTLTQEVLDDIAIAFKQHPMPY